MKKLDLGRTVSIIANIGVIAGIVFLAFEIRQNNDLLASQSRANLFEMRAAMQRDFFLDAGGIADLIYREQEGEELSDVELRRLEARRAFVLLNFEMMYEEEPVIEPSLIYHWTGYFETDPGLLDLWQEMKEFQNPAFVEWMEQNVVNER